MFDFTTSEAIQARNRAVIDWQDRYSAAAADVRLAEAGERPTLTVTEAGEKYSVTEHDVFIGLAEQTRLADGELWSILGVRPFAPNAPSPYEAR